MIDGMELEEWITISAIIIGPILAVQAEKLLEFIRDKKTKRLRLFHTLMATRATRLSNEHVAALNMIDIEFYGRKILGVRFQTPKEKSITNAWKNYNDHLNIKYLPEQYPVWFERNEQLFTTLLYKMSLALGYDFDEVQLKRDCYRPIAHGDLEEDQYRLRKALLEIMDGRRPLLVTQFTGEKEQKPETTEQNPVQGAVQVEEHTKKLEIQ
ncbi:MAG TPA: hypothetical protein DF296_09515 [Candidatus Margulisbacteria bacterium]|nr:hypothetical protein [Candidatus Margulisiibacteriota bacterium]